jgi:hypothetical protein
MTEIDFEKMGLEFESIIRLREIAEHAKPEIIKAVESQSNVRFALDGLAAAAELSRVLRVIYKLNNEDLAKLIKILQDDGFLKIQTYAGLLCYKIIK